MPKIAALVILVFSYFGICQAQDSVKTKVVKPVVRQVAKGVTGSTGKTGAAKYYYRPKTYYAKPATTQPSVTTSAAPPAIQPTAPVQTPVSTDKSLRGQYQYVMSKIYHYQQPMVAALWKNVNDSLNAAKSQLKAANAKLASQGQSITSLQNDVKTKEATANDATARQDEIALLGIPMTKTAYNFLMWGLVIGMAAVLAIVILRTSGANREAKHRTQLYDEISEEFTAFKAKAKEKEMKLARELQTERNKVDELMGRG